MNAQYLNRLSWKQVDDLDRNQTTILVPIASTEQHGYHLPLSTDASIMENALARLVKEPRDYPRRYLITPLIPFGVSPEHLRFAGSISLRCSTVTALLGDILSSLRGNGFEDYIFLNSHGGNSPYLSSIARELRLIHSCEINLMDLYGKAFYADMPPVLEGTYVDIHGGEYETSLMMAIRPELVDMEHDEKHLKTQITALPAAWMTEELSPSGVIGDATLARVEKGNKFNDFMFERLSQLLQRHTWRA